MTTGMRVRWVAVMAVSAVLAMVLTGPAVARTNFPDTFDLPDGFQPEGIAIDASGTAYFGSLADGDVYAADLRTGFGAVISEGPGTPAVGLKIDSRGRIFVAGGPSGLARVVDSDTGETIRSYAFAPPGQGFVNDVVLTRYGAWFTDSQNARLYGVPIGPRGGLPRSAFVTVPLRGEWVQDPTGFNANGISTTPDGRALLVVQSVTGFLFRVNPFTGVARRVDLGGVLLTNGDGLLREGRTLYVVRNQLNLVAVVDLNQTGTRGRLVDQLTSPSFDVPTTIAGFRDSLYLPNARFSTPPTPTTEYAVTRIDKP